MPPNMPLSGSYKLIIKGVGDKLYCSTHYLDISALEARLT